MMMSLFISFDPYTHVLNILPAFLIPLLYFSNKLMMKSNFNMIMVIDQIKTNMKSNMFGLMKFIVNVMVIILVMNIVGVIPYTYTVTAQMALTFMLALPLWMTAVWASLFSNPVKFVSHLVPQGSPLVLSQFMVIIESVSLLIRPITLSVRLMANMTAGHILLILCSSPFILFSMYSLPLMVLVCLETAVAVVQMYVMTVLIMMYTSESN